MPRAIWFWIKDVVPASSIMRCIWPIEQSKGCIDFIVVIICKALCNMVCPTVLRLLFLMLFPENDDGAQPQQELWKVGTWWKISLISFFVLIFRFQLRLPADTERMGNVPASCRALSLSSCQDHCRMMDLSGLWKHIWRSKDGSWYTCLQIAAFRNYDDLMLADCSHRINNFLGCMIQHNYADISRPFLLNHKVHKCSTSSIPNCRFVMVNLNI